MGDDWKPANPFIGPHTAYCQLLYLTEGTLRIGVTEWPFRFKTAEAFLLLSSKLYRERARSTDHVNLIPEFITVATIVQDLVPDGNLGLSKSRSFHN